MTLGATAKLEAHAEERRSGSGPIVGAVARTPVSVRTKLLVGFVIIAALLVLVGVLGLIALGKSNARVEQLRTLQTRAAQSKGLESDVSQLGDLVRQRANVTPDAGQPIGRGLEVAPSSYSFLDITISESLTRFLGDATELETAEPVLFQRVYALYGSLAALTHTALLQDEKGKGNGVGPLVQRETAIAARLAPVIDRLTARTTQETAAVVAQNQRSYTSSRNLFIGVAAASVILALALGFVLSWSLITPLRQTEARLAEIAEGDFTRHVEVPNRDEFGVLAANVNKMNDELGRLYRELETVSRHKSDFLATMSHELRTPLNAIIGFSDVLREQMFGDLNEQQLSYVDDVLAAGRHLLSLINDVLDLAKIEAGRLELDFGAVSIPDVLQGGMTMHGERASRGGIALGLHVEPDEIVITADDRRIRQVVFNLLSNAIKFTPRNGRIDVSATVHDSLVEVAVADTGSGIAPGDLDRIFEEFDQGGGAAADHVEGTGLGLPLSRKFVELHGGRLWVESTVGAGSTFRFTLPVTKEA